MVMKKIKYILLIVTTLFFVCSLTSCGKLQKYKNKVSYTEFIESFQQTMDETFIENAITSDFVYKHEYIIKKVTGKEEKTNYTLEYDNDIYCVKHETSGKRNSVICGLSTLGISMNIYSLEDNEFTEMTSLSYTLIDFLNDYSLNSIRINEIQSKGDFYIDGSDTKRIFTYIYNLTEFQINTLQIVVSQDYITKYTNAEFTDSNSKNEYIRNFYEIKQKETNLEKYYKMIVSKNEEE